MEITTTLSNFTSATRDNSIERPFARQHTTAASPVTAQETAGVPGFYTAFVTGNTASEKKCAQQQKNSALLYFFPPLVRIKKAVLLIYFSGVPEKRAILKKNRAQQQKNGALLIEKSAHTTGKKTDVPAF